MDGAQMNPYSPLQSVPVNPDWQANPFLN